MDKPVLSDKNEFPTEEIIFSHIGKNKRLWSALFKYIRENHPDFSESWKFYNDGKSWLLKVAHKKKTIFWLSLIENTFRTTFYFTAKAEEAIAAGSLPQEYKTQFTDPAKTGKLKGITVIYAKPADVEAAKVLIGMKKSPA